MKIHIPLTKKDISTNVNDNFLVSNKNIYLMDNHRLALWSWFQEVDLNSKYNLIHIDAHPDLSDSALADFDKIKMPIQLMELNEYRTLIQSQFNAPLFRWDNYIKIFTEKFPENYVLSTSMSFTHHQGSKQTLTKDLSSIYLLKELEDLFTQKKFVNDNQWIVNLDLDYFFTSMPHKKLMFSEDYLELIAKFIQNGLDNKMIKVLTVAFSPECCGSWENAELAFKILNKIWKIDFTTGE